MASSSNTYPHYAWALGHLLVLISGAWYLKAWVTFQSTQYAWWYKASFFGAISSYAIVCYKSLSSQSPGAILQRAAADENVQYLLLALFWWFSKPVPLALVPYFVFSLFHVLTFTRTNIIPLISPPTPVTGSAGAAPTTPPSSGIAKSINSWVKANYDIAMVVVARVELLILLRVLFGVFLFQNSLLVPVIYAHFLRLRFHFSPFSHAAVVAVDARLSSYAEQSGPDSAVKKGYALVKGAVVRWATSIIEPNAAQSAPGAAGGRTAGRR